MNKHRHDSLSLSLSLSPSRLPRTIITCTVVFLLCLATGLLSGTLFRNNQKPAEAASANITVVDNNQVITEDQGTTTIVRTSTVTVKDTSATLGYTLAARIENNSIPSSTVTIYSATSTTCTQASPCAITSDPTPILETTTTSATQPDGDATDWTVTITLPGATALGNYILDIAYSQDPILPPPGPQEPNPSTPTTYGAMQTMTNAECSTTRGTAFDARNGQTYYIQKIGNLCWMETNLRYAGDGDYDDTWGYTDDRYATSATNTTGSTNDNARPLTPRQSGIATYNAAERTDPGGPTDIALAGSFYGYLYNWCAAMGGQQNSCNSTSTAGFDTALSICPAGWRLPTGGTAGEYQALNTAINTSSTTSDAGLRTNFLAVYSGFYYSALSAQGSSGYYWSSTVTDATSAYTTFFNATLVYPGTYTRNKFHGFAVRCVL